jgi:hypothetical protein
MAIARCDTHGRPKAAKPPEYGKQPHLPVGHPNSGVICGSKGCTNPAQIWLKQDEEREYLAGGRIFSIHTYTAKVRVE